MCLIKSSRSDIGLSCCHFFSQVFSSGSEESNLQLDAWCPSHLGYSDISYLSRKAPKVPPYSRRGAIRPSTCCKPNPLTLFQPVPSLQGDRTCHRVPAKKIWSPLAQRSDRKTSCWCGAFKEIPHRPSLSSVEPQRWKHHCNIWPNSAPLHDIRRQNLSDLDFDLQGQMWWCHLTLHIWYGFLMIYIVTTCPSLTFEFIYRAQWWALNFRKENR